MNQFGNSYSPSQLGVRPTAVLSTAFLSQAFLWMFVGLAVTTGIGWFISGLSEATLTRLSGLFFPILIGQFILALAFGFVIRSIPATVGLGLFFLYAAATGVTVGFVLLLYPVTSVVAAGSGAAAVFGGAALYGVTTKRDLTSIGAYLFMALIGIIVASFVNLLLVHSDAFGYIVSWIVVVVFTGFTAYHVQRIRNGDIAAWAGTAEKGAVMAAFLLYLDFINLFFALLRILGGNRR
jgi:FtsH-binding integral membrane protein